MRRGHRINNLLEQLYDIDKQLGGQAKSKNIKQKSQEFDQVKVMVLEKLKEIEELQQNRDDRTKKFGVDGDTILLSSKVRDNLNEVEQEIKDLQRTLVRYIKKPKKFPKDIIDQYAFELSKLKEGLLLLKKKEFGEQAETMEQGATQFKDFISQPQNQNLYRYDLTNDEQEALNRWNKNDEYMDKQLDEVIDGYDRLQDKVIVQGNKIDYTNAQIKELQKQVEKTTKEFTNQNQRLKELVKTYRRPNKMCLDITLILLLLGLVTVGINMFKNM